MDDLFGWQLRGSSRQCDQRSDLQRMSRRHVLDVGQPDGMHDVVDLRGSHLRQHAGHHHE
jgi:hypothetical protein